MVLIMSSNDYIQLKKKLLHNEYNRLNEVQQEAVFRSYEPMLILAGAGSGKTTTVVNKISYLVKYGDAFYCQDVPHGITQEVLDEMNSLAKSGKAPSDHISKLIANNRVEPYRILAITFTNKAAKEMKERVEKMLGDKGADLWVGTFHSTCVRLLRRDIDRIEGYNKNFVIYDSADQLTLIKSCMQQLSIPEREIAPRDVQNAIGRAKDQLLTPREFEKKSENDYKLKTAARVYTLYQKRIKENNALDFDDIIMLTIKLLKENDDIHSHYQNKFKYVLVDEYQDTNLAQAELIWLFASEHKNICAVGDDDQSIYGWRGADISNILNFEQRYKGCRVVKLEQNYRSTSTILDAANNVIQNNAGRKGKKLWTENSEGDKLTYYLAMDARDEANYIVSTILDQCKKGRNFGDFAILYRTNAQSRMLEDSFIRDAVPYKIVGGLRFYERKEIKDIMAYLRVIQNPNDSVSIKRIINHPRRGIGDTTIEKLEQLSFETGIGMFDIAKSAKQYSGLERVATKLQPFVQLIEELRLLKDSLKASDIIKQTIDKTGLIPEYRKEGEIEAQTRIENMEELISVAVELEKQQAEYTLADFLAYTSLIADVDSLDEEQESVTLMTIHSAKGLEYPVVYVCGMEDGLFPKIRDFSIDETELEEERRLCYVAITRAKEKLYILSASERTLYGRTSYSKPSRFIKEIPPNLIAGMQEAMNKRKPEPSKSTISVPFRADNYIAKLAADHNRTVHEFTTGMNVIHKKFGNGIISAVEASSGLVVLTIDFETCGRKNLISTAITLA